MKASNLKLICDAISGSRHEHYKHTVEMANNLRNIITADDKAVGELLSRIIRRETEDEFEQRKRLTRLLTRALCNRIKRPFNKALRKDNASVSFGKEEKLFHDTFFGDKSLYNYLVTHVHTRQFRDPNAFLLLSIGEYDSNKEKAKVVPEIIPAADVLMFEYQFEMLQRIVIKYGAGYKLFAYGKKSENAGFTNDGNTIKGENMGDGEATEYTKDLNLAAFLVDENILRGEANPVMLKIAGKVYKFTEHEPKLEGIQAMRIGYEFDSSTDEKTVVSPLYPAIPRIEKMIKSSSELDISLAMHVFTQKIVQTESCKGWSNDGGTYFRCNHGTLQGLDKTCPNCDGTGLEPIAKSGMDIIRVQLGQGGDSDHDLDNIVRYIGTDIETPKFLDEFLSRHENLCMRDVFPNVNNSEASSGGVQKTATQVTVDYESMYDVLLEYINQFANWYRFCMTTGMKLKDKQEPEFSIAFPEDFDIKTLGELIQDYKDSVDLPVAVRKAIRAKIARKLSTSDSDSDKKEAVRISHEPFIDKSSGDIKYLISQNLVSKRDQVLWANYDKIMTELENHHGKVWFNMKHELREQEIQTRIDLITKSLPQAIELPPAM